MSNLQFHDGLRESIDVKRMTEFDVNSILDQLYGNRDVDSSEIIEELGPWVLDFSNIFGWSENISDVDSQSARLFQVWAEDAKSKKVIGIIRGYFTLVPFTFSSSTLKDYYMLEAEVPFYPMAIITSLRTTIKEAEPLDDFLKELLNEVSQTWMRRRTEVISNLESGTELWKRYVYSFEQIIHFTIMCPSIHRSLIDALKRRDYRITGVMQLLASSSPFYDKATIDHHIRKVKAILEKQS